GCGDDTADDMGVDMGPRDMTAVAEDMTDATVPSAPSGEIVVADVVGTVWTAGPPDAGDVSVPMSHRIFAANQFPMASFQNADYTNLMTNTSTLAISGCVANRYDFVSASGKKPVQDVDVGTITLGAVNKGTTMTTGWDATFRFAQGAT